MTPAIIYKETRKNFPNANAPDSSGDSYCVLGALRQQIRPKNVSVMNPTLEYGAGILMQASPKLEPHKALNYASLIVAANDSGNIERAWKILKLVLTTRPKQPRQ